MSTNGKFFFKKTKVYILKISKLFFYENSDTFIEKLKDETPNDRNDRGKDHKERKDVA